MVSSVSPAGPRTTGPAPEEEPGAGRDATAHASGPASAERRRAAGWAAIMLACAVGVLVPALLFGLSGPPRAIVDLPTAGPLVAWSLPVVRLLMDACAMLTSGALLAAAVLVPAASGTLAPAAVRCVRAAGGWALGWAACAVLLLVLTLADILGVPLAELAAQPVLELAGSFAQGRALVIGTAIAMAIALGCRRVTGPRGAAVLLGAALLATLPPLYAGHSASATDHDMAVSSMMVHGVATAAWAGGLAAILLHLRGAREILPAALTRFSTVALAAFAACGISGVVNVVARFDDVTWLWTSRYGLLVLAKIVLLAALGGFGLAHRRRTIAALVEGRARRPFLRLATGEVAVMAATVGLAVALSRTPPPASDAETSWIALQLGYDVPPLEWGSLLTAWRLDLFVLLTLIGAGLAYGAGMRRLRRRGEGWPASRALAWYGGLGVLALALLSGVGTYGRAMFSVHAVQFLALTVLAPPLLACAAPVTLARRARGAGRARGAAWAAHPLTGFAAYAVPPAVFYFTDWFFAAQWSHAVHLVTQAVFLGAAFHYFRIVLAADPPAVPLDPGNRVRLLIAGLPVHLLLAAALFDGPVVAESWYRQLGLMWGSPDAGTGGGLARETVALVTDQRVGAAIIGMGAIAAFLVILVVLGLRLRRRARAAGRSTA
jgi:Predicted membrane protein